jgi:hypothetical protein
MPRKLLNIMQCSEHPQQQGNTQPQMLLVLKLRILTGPFACAAVTLLILTRPYSMDYMCIFGHGIELRVFVRVSKHCVTELYSQPHVHVYLR